MIVCTIFVEIPFEICEITVSIEKLFVLKDDFINLDAIFNMVCDVDDDVPFRCPSEAALDK